MQQIYCAKKKKEKKKLDGDFGLAQLWNCVKSTDKPAVSVRRKLFRAIYTKPRVPPLLPLALTPLLQKKKHRPFRYPLRHHSLLSPER